MNMQRGDKHMNSIMQSIRPKWCELIANGKKTIEVRKTRPKTPPPFKVYIYCTKSRDVLWILNKDERIYSPNKIADIFTAKSGGGVTRGNGKVIGEYICDSIETICERKAGGRYIHKMVDRIAVEKYTAMTIDEFLNYAGLGQCFAWHISELVIYDKPKELRDFKKYGVCPCDGKCTLLCSENMIFCAKCNLTRPPMSWFYVEELTC